MAKYCIIPTIWYSGNIKTMDTAKKKKSVVARGWGWWGGEEEAEGSRFLGQRKYSVWMDMNT